MNNVANGTVQLDDKERIRYSRQLMLDGIGEEGQRRLKAARVVVVGCGGLGSPVLMYLAASGVGTLRFIDHDRVELSNLQRQVLYKINHLGQPKVSAAGKVLASLNNRIELEGVCDRLEDDNAGNLLGDADLVIDCSDNFSTRYLINRVCAARSLVLVAGAAQGESGQVMGFDFRSADSACYHCLFPESTRQTPLNCANAGVFAPLLGMVGAMQAQLALNYLLGHQQGGLLRTLNASGLEQRAWELTRDSACPVCRSSPVGCP